MGLKDSFWKIDLYLRGRTSLENEFNKAAIEGNLWRMKYLVRNKDVNVRNQSNFAIRWAAHSGHIRVMEYLLDMGADIHAKDDEAIVKAAGNGKIETIKLCLKRGLDINAQDGEALKLAAENGRGNAISFLVLKGVDIQKYGQEAIERAVEKNYKKTAQIIKRHMSLKPPSSFGM